MAPMDLGHWRLQEHTRLSTKLNILPGQLRILVWEPQIRFHIISADAAELATAEPYKEYTDDLSIYSPYVLPAVSTGNDQSGYRKGWPGFGCALTEKQAMLLHQHVRARQKHDYAGRMDPDSLLRENLLTRGLYQVVHGAQYARSMVLQAKATMAEYTRGSYQQLQRANRHQELDKILCRLLLQVETAERMLLTEHVFLKSFCVLESACWRVCVLAYVATAQVVECLDDLPGQENRITAITQNLERDVDRLRGTVDILGAYLIEIQPIYPM